MNQSVLEDLPAVMMIDESIYCCSKKSFYTCFPVHLLSCVTVLLCRLVTGPHLFFCWNHSVSLLLMTVFTLSASFLSGLSALIPRLNLNKESSSITTTEAQTVSDDNRVCRLYDNSTPTANTTTPKDLHTDTLV